MATISEALAIAVQHHQAGRLEIAEEIYRRILAVEPDHADALHLLGVVARQVGKHEVAVESIGRAIGLRGSEAAFHNSLGEAYLALRRIPEAIACYQRALELQPGHAKAWYNLGVAFQDRRSLDEAVPCYRRAVELKPDFTEAYINLGNALKDQGALDEAIAWYRRALELKPDFAEAYVNLGNASKDQGALNEAVACYRRAAELKPDFAEAHGNLGNVLKDQGELDEAVACYRRAVALKADSAEAHNNLGVALKDLGNVDDAIACYRQALELNPCIAEAHNNLGIALRDLGELEEAIACYRRALEVKPSYPEAHSNLGIALKDQGKLDEAVACYRRALELKPGFAEAHSNLLYALNFSPGCDAQYIYDEHRRWNRQHAEPLAKFITPHANDRSVDRRLRVGYVSPDFRMHPVGRFLLPLIEAHDHHNFEVFCYASLSVADALSEQFRARADVWRNMLGFSDGQLAEAIRQDKIDILVDLTMHMANNRLLVFARKPAPVQVTYLAYCGTTGLSTMDYRLTDPYLDPPGQPEGFYSEQSIHLPETYWCYRPASETPPCGPVPALQTGRVTFGCLNNFCKVTEATLAAWIRILQATPESRLLLHAHAGSHRDRVRDYLARHGISPARLGFTDIVPWTEYCGLYGQMDVALDPFPYGGGTTTCDALWMGVPVVSLAGQTAVGRGGLSILTNVGLPELVATNVDGYVRIAAELANDLHRLAELRSSLRDRMLKSPLMDAPRFARGIEAAYHTMWQRWCAGGAPVPRTSKM